MNQAHQWNRQRLDHALLNVFLERNGIEYNIIASKRGHRRRIGMCYMNALRLVWKRPELRYVEGVASSSGDWGFSHAWCIDPDGAVIDVTLDEPSTYSYFGVPMKTDFVSRWVLHHGSHGMFCDPMAIKPMLELDPGLRDDVRAKQWIAKSVASRKREP
jgi:hypothetical protein